MQYIIIILSIAQLYIFNHILRKLTPIDNKQTLYSPVKKALKALIKSKTIKSPAINQQAVNQQAVIISPIKVNKLKQLQQELTSKL